MQLFMLDPRICLEIGITEIVNYIFFRFANNKLFFKIK
jgi:hypothetical protein